MFLISSLIFLSKEHISQIKKTRIIDIVLAGTLRGITDDCYFRDKVTLRQRLHGTGSVWNRYKIGTEKPCVYTGPGGSGTDRICYLLPNGSTYEGDPMCNHAVSQT